MSLRSITAFHKHCLLGKEGRREGRKEEKGKGRRKRKERKERKGRKEKRKIKERAHLDFSEKHRTLWIPL